MSATRKIAEYIVKQPRGLYSLIKNSIKHKTKIASGLSFPAHVTIEPTTRCNLRCPICETGNGSLDRRLDFMDYDLYVRLVDECAENNVNTILLYFMGESFLHPRIYEMIDYAAAKGIFVDICTNGDIINPEKVVACNLGQLSIQIGGMTQATHEQYRRKSNLERILKNVYRIQELLRVQKSTAIFEMGFIVMKHNEHEVHAFIDLVNSLENFKGNIIDPCVRTIEEGFEYLPENKKYWFYDVEDFKKGILRPAITKTNNSCSWIWNSMVVMVNGDVVPCCRDPKGENILGNVVDRTMKEVWNSSESVEFRESILRKQSDVGICNLCAGYGYPQLTHDEKLGIKHDKVS